MSKFYEGDFYERGTECQFEPASVEILCVECEKPTGEYGTCTDRRWCADCRDMFQSVADSPEDWAQTVIGLESGEYHYKPVKRALHYGTHGDPACRTYTNKQPVTTSQERVTCSKCLRLLKGRQPKLTEHEARNKVANEARHGVTMEARQSSNSER